MSDTESDIPRTGFVSEIDDKCADISIKYKELFRKVDVSNIIILTSLIMRDLNDIKIGRRPWKPWSGRALSGAQKRRLAHLILTAVVATSEMTLTAIIPGSPIVPFLASLTGDTIFATIESVYVMGWHKTKK